MSRGQFGQGKRPLDTFFWVNEITGEITYPPLKTDPPAASPASTVTLQERPISPCGGEQGALPGDPGPPDSPGQKPAPPPPLGSSLKDPCSRSSFPSALTPGLARAGALSSLPFSEIPVTISALGGAPPTPVPIGPAPRALASQFPPSPSAPEAFTYKLKNVLTGNNRFCF